MSLFSVGTEVYEFPVTPIEHKDLLDPTGAGDSFVAGVHIATSVLLSLDR